MTKDTPKDMAASVRHRLLNLAHERNEEFQIVLIRYGLERLLYRLSLSEHRNLFVLKGAMLFQLWSDQPHRSTLDLDLLAKGDDAVTRFERIFTEIFAQPVEDDGLRFLADSIHGEVIREDQQYGGVRISGVVLLGVARIPIQVDLGFGDAITPKPEQIEYPSLLGLPAPVLRAYPKETVVAEKYQAMVMLGIANSRMKDFYDLWVLAGNHEFDGPLLAQAIGATFKRRGTALPEKPPLALTDEFSGDRAKQAQWRAFVMKGRLVVEVPPFDEVVKSLAQFLMPPTDALTTGRAFSRKWPVGGPWK
jgi:hypothetical protein